MNRATQIAVGAGVGYLVGRHRKLGLVAVLGGAAVAGRLSGDRRLLRRGAKLLGDSSELGRIAGLGAPLLSATRAAATSAVTRRIDSVSAGLRERTDRQRAAGQRAAGRGRPDEPDEPAERPRRKLSDIRPTARRGRRQADVEDDDLDEFEEDQYEDDDSVDEEPDTEADLRDEDVRESDVDHPDADAGDADDADDADDLARTRPAAGRESERKRPGSTSRQPARRRTPTEAAPVRRRTR
ncbi:hypothetical protein AAH979_15800 [Plantactinospora sp. ZYX-F-223]|uniref:hypothetical protein n=1 Tax=Plantactinospora sp. ZYX-F-223 TaxID=3144103 RepID=UPI0031FC99A7